MHSLLQLIQMKDSSKRRKVELVCTCLLHTDSRLGFGFPDRFVAVRGYRVLKVTQRQRGHHLQRLRTVN